MSGEIEQDHLLLATLLTLVRLADRCGNRMTRFGCRNDSFGLCKQTSGLEALQLRNIDRFHHLVLQQLRDNRSGAVIPQTTGMNVGRSKIVPQSEHRQQRRISRFITKIVTENATRQFRARIGFGCQKTGLLP